MSLGCIYSNGNAVCSSNTVDGEICVENVLYQRSLQYSAGIDSYSLVPRLSGRFGNLGMSPHAVMPVGLCCPSESQFVRLVVMIFIAYLPLSHLVVKVTN